MAILSHRLFRTYFAFGILVLFVVPSSAVILPLDNLQLSDLYFGYRIGMYSPADAPAKSPPGNGESYILFDVDLSMAPGSTDSSSWVQALVFPYEDSDFIGDNEGDLCDSDGVMVDTSDPNVHLVNMTVPGQHKIQFDIKKSAMYYALITKCTGKGDSVILNGQMVFMNPFGYLPGEDYPYIPFFAVMLVGYTLMGLAWAILNIKYRKDLLTLQHCITGVLIASFFESVFALADFDTINVAGIRSLGLEVANIFFELVRKTIGRLLLIVVSMGFGVVKPSLGKAKWPVILVGVFYLLSSVGLEVATHKYYERKVDATTVALFSAPVSFVDATIYVWIVTSISKIIQQLTTSNQTAKLQMYLKLKNVIVGSVFLSVFWVGYQTYFTFTNKFQTEWQKLWTFEAYWQLLYFVILGAISWVWRPNANNVRYAYSMEVGSEEENASHPSSIVHMGGPDTIDNDDLNHHEEGSTTEGDQTSIPMGQMSSFESAPPSAFALTEEDDEDHFLQPTERRSDQ